jgi:hypothetical protein
MAILTLSEALDRASRGEPIVPAAPKHLKHWTRPRDYFGAEWSRYYSAGVGQSRDSDCLEQSNFAVMLHELGARATRSPWSAKATAASRSSNVI